MAETEKPKRKRRNQVQELTEALKFMKQQNNSLLEKLQQLGAESKLSKSRMDERLAQRIQELETQLVDKIRELQSYKEEAYKVETSPQSDALSTLYASIKANAEAMSFLIEQVRKD